MNNDEFDKELTTLYGQRKAQVKTPYIDIDNLGEPKSSRSKLLKLMLLSLTGGAASFGVFALITHFASPKQQLHRPADDNKVVSVEVVEVEKKQSLIVKKDLPPIPKVSITPEVIKPSISPDETIAAVPLTNVEITHEKAVLIPNLTKPDSMKIVPLRKVLPEYPATAIRNKIQGKVALSYEVDELGKVVNIAIDRSIGGPLLRKAALKALKQWQYPKESDLEGRYEVEFDFHLGS